MPRTADAKRSLHDPSERRFQALAEAAPVILWTAGADGWIDWYNERWYEYTGQTREEAAGWGWQAAHHPEDFPEVMRRWPESIATGRPFEMEFRLRGSDGVFRWFLTRVQPLFDDAGAILRWYGSNADVDEQRKARERSVRIAQTLQAVFLPKRLPHTDRLRFDAMYIAAEKDALVGGDWYDAFELEDGRFAFSIGDVAGHGLEASVIAGSIRQAIVALTFRIDDPAEVLRELNRIIRFQNPDTMVTAIVGSIDRERSVLRYTCAGHPPPIVAHRAGERARIEPYGGIPLGIFAQLGELETRSISIVDDMIVALYTDGLTEARRDIDGAEQMLCDLLPRLVGDVMTRTLAQAVTDAVLPPKSALDDAALMLIQFSPVPLELTGQSSRKLHKTWRFHSSDSHSAHASRSELMAYVAGLASDPEETFFAELVLGEILANTVEHAPGLVEIVIDWSAEKPVLRVRDTGPGLSVSEHALPEDVFNENGRGIFLIRTLAEDVHIGPASGFGTEIRAVLPVRRVMESPPAG